MGLKSFTWLRNHQRRMIFCGYLFILVAGPRDLVSFIFTCIYNAGHIIGSTLWWFEQEWPT